MPCAHDGPTTKADCLNALWLAMLARERECGRLYKAIALHDAEDVVHPLEIRIFDRLIERFDLVQLPVVPLVDDSSRWISGSYIDEFCEAHSKTLVVREFVGARIPAAGVGCAFSRDALVQIAKQNGGAPFDARSLTEDYELGLRLGEIGARGILVRLPESAGGPVVAVHAHFPATLNTAVTQKARWIVGIALSGWDRLGWRGSFAENWMRLHDRRSILAAILLIAAYAALVLTVGLWLIDVFGGPALKGFGPLVDQLLLVSGALLVWRLTVRSIFVAQVYGWREGLRSIPRALVANIIAMMAARRALGIYWRMRSDGIVRWDKTGHKFPVSLGA